MTDKQQQLAAMFAASHGKADTRNLPDILEAMIDSHGLSAVLDALSEVCHAKAEHLAVNWQDTGSAKLWTKAAHAIDALTARADVKAVSP